MASSIGGGELRRRVRAAQYVRMSTEHQKYSTENQAEVIAQYADRRGFEIVRTYEDSGKSGLRLDGRQALQLLIADMSAAAPPILPRSSYTMSVAGVGFRMQTRVLITNLSAGRPASASITAPNNSRMTAA